MSPLRHVWRSMCVERSTVDQFPILLAGVERVLDLHKPVMMPILTEDLTEGPLAAFCEQCCFWRWPCDTVRALCDWDNDE